MFIWCIDKLFLDNSVISINIKIAQNELDTLKFCVNRMTLQINRLLTLLVDEKMCLGIRNA